MERNIVENVKRQDEIYTDEKCEAVRLRRGPERYNSALDPHTICGYNNPSSAKEKYEFVPSPMMT